MPKDFDDKIHRLLDGNLNEDERKLLENQLEGSQECVEHLHRLLQVKDLMKELPRHKPPIDLVAAVRSKRLSEKGKRPFSPESVFGGSLLRIATIAALMAIVFFVVFKNDVNKKVGVPTTIADLDPVKSNDNHLLPVRKASVLDYDILEKGYQPNLKETINNFEIEISKDVDNAISIKLTDIQNQVIQLKSILKKLHLNPVYKPGGSSPIYSIKDLSGNVLSKLVAELLKIDSKLELDPLIKLIAIDSEGNITNLDPESLIDIHLILKN